MDLIQDYVIDQEDTMKKLITFFLNLVMKHEVEQLVGNTRYECSEKRKAHRNGKRSSCLKTKYGDIVLDISDLCEKPLETVVFDRYSRVERSLENVIAESYIQGVSTRRVRSVVESSSEV